MIKKSLLYSAGSFQIPRLSVSVIPIADHSALRPGPPEIRKYEAGSASFGEADHQMFNT